MKLDPSNGLQLKDWFTPSDWVYRDSNDYDLGSSGPLLIPGTSLILGRGKTGILYLLDTANLGKESASDAGAVQVQTVSPFEIRGGPVYWQRSAANGGPLLYICGSWDVLKAYPFNGTTFATSPSAEGSVQETWPGGILALSANGDTPGGGVLWETVVTSGDAENSPPAPGELLAYDAANVSQELWNSATNSSRDGFGNFAKFVPPLVVNGKVYVATQSNQVAVYGLLATYTALPISPQFGDQFVGETGTAQSVMVTNTGTLALPISSITRSGASAGQFTETNNCLPSVGIGSTCTINVVFAPTGKGSKTATLDVNGGGASCAKSLRGYRACVRQGPVS
ncbi:MAG: choice-of-anchor D domain-containing protein [Steroidobacteraceae bacterium]